MAKKGDSLLLEDLSGATYIDDSEDEIFFAPFLEKQLEFAKQNSKRRTEIYCPACRLNRPSLIEFRLANKDIAETESHGLDVNNDSTHFGINSTHAKSLTHSVEDIRQSNCASSDDESFDNSGLTNVNDSLEIHARRSSELLKKRSDDYSCILETTFESNLETSASNYYSACCSSSIASDGLHGKQQCLTYCSVHSPSSVNSFHSAEQNLDDACPSRSLSDSISEIPSIQEESQLSVPNTGLATPYESSSPDVDSSSRIYPDGSFLLSAPPASPELAHSILREDNEVQIPTLTALDKSYADENSNMEISHKSSEVEISIECIVPASTESRFQHVPDLTSVTDNCNLDSDHNSACREHEDLLTDESSAIDEPLSSDILLKTKYDVANNGNISEKVCVPFCHLALDAHLPPEMEQHASSSLHDGAGTSMNIIDKSFKDVKEQECQTSFNSNLLTGSSETGPTETVGLSGIGHTNGNAQRKCCAIIPPPGPSAEKKYSRIPVFKLKTPTPKSKSPFLKPVLFSHPEATGRFDKAWKQSPVPKSLASSHGARRKRFEHIVSPVSHYIHEVPVPALIANSQPLGRQVAGLRLGRKPGIAAAVSLPQIGRNPKLKLSANKQISKNETVDTNVRSKARTKLEFSCAANKENFEDSIIGKLGLTSEELNKLENQKLKKEVEMFVKHKKALYEYSAIQKVENDTKTASLHDHTAMPFCTYKGPSSLVLMQKEMELVTKLHTLKNKQVPVSSPCRPLVLKHCGQRKKIQWADCKKFETQKLTASCVNPCTVPRILLNSQMGISWLKNDTSGIEASIVEVVNTGCSGK